MFLDSDDWWDEDLLQSVADVIEQDEPDIVFFGYRDEWFSMDDRQLQTVPKIPKAISIKNETTNLLSKEAKEFILEAEKHTVLRAKPVCPAVFERNKMMEATQYESYFSS